MQKTFPAHTIVFPDYDFFYYVCCYQNCYVMALIKSISGIRGTIGGKHGETLSPLDTVKFTAAYGTWLQKNHPENKNVVIGRDGRISGEMIQRLVISTLNAVGINVIDLGLSTTPTVEMDVVAKHFHL